MRKPTRILAVTLLLLCCVAGVAQAITIPPGYRLDQDFDPNISNPSMGINSRVGQNGANITEQAQTFKVGNVGTGAQFGGVELFVYLPAGQSTTGLSFGIDIRNTTSGGSPNASLIHRNIPFSQLPTEPAYGAAYPSLFVDLSSAHLSITQNDVLAITLSAPASNGFTWHGIGNNSGGYYSRGEWFYRNNGVEWISSTSGGTFDLGFATYLAPVPIPGTALLLGSGLLGLVGIARRRSRK